VGEYYEDCFVYCFVCGEIEKGFVYFRGVHLLSTLNARDVRRDFHGGCGRGFVLGRRDEIGQ
jgi:hypothetical protein